MATMAYKWVTIYFLALFMPGLHGKETAIVHPIFVSVTEIEHNAKEKTLEISCKLFTEDFEKTLRKHYTGKIELLDEKIKAQMGTVVNDYIQKHLHLKADGKPVQLKFIGFEQQEGDIVSFFQADNIIIVKNVQVFNDFLYDYSSEQMGIVHVTVNGNRKSTRLNNPATDASFEF